MNIKTDDELLKQATKAMRIAVVIYVAVKQIIYTSMFEAIFWIPRAWAGAVMLLIALGIPQIKRLSKHHISWIVPVALGVTEVVLVASFGGDRLTYTLLIGCALISLLYMETKGLLITVTVTCTAAVAALFVFGRTLIGDTEDFSNDLYNLLGLVVVDIVIFLIGKYAIGTTTKAKQAVEAALRQAQEANRAKSNFLATMSHEIRTPMNAILGIAQLQLQNDTLPEMYMKALGRIIDSGNTLLSIINDILDMSKIEAGNMSLVPTEYDIPSLINDAVQLNVVRIGTRPIEFVLDIDENLPQKLLGDELRLKQVLNNLLSNAIKYTDKGRVKLTVSAQTKDDVYLEFSVSDTGQGMKPEDCKKLFSEEYTRFNEEANRSKEGTGLGLSITKKLVELMSGSITVDSEYGVGSTFTVIVKQQVINATPIGSETAKKLREFSYSDNKFKERRRTVRNIMPYGRVLVVDDVDSNLFIAEGMLAQYKLCVEAVNSGYKAIEKVESGNTYDVIFMDHMMPGMDGIETTKKLRESGYGGIIIALTANVLVGNEEMFRQNGFDGFIAKPIDIRAMDKILNQHVREKHPDEAKKYDELAAAQRAHPGFDKHSGNEQAAAEKRKKEKKLRSVFTEETRRAITTLRETIKDGDIGLYTTTVHGLKSALANVGEDEKSKVAYTLEKAGKEGNVGYIKSMTEDFIRILEALLDDFEKLDSTAEQNDDTDIVENTDLLEKQLETIMAACVDFDENAVYNALEELKGVPVKTKTAEALEKIKDKLMIDSDFDEAAKLAADLKTDIRGE